VYASVISLVPKIPEDYYWHRLTQVDPKKDCKMVVCECVCACKRDNIRQFIMQPYKMYNKAIVDDGPTGQMTGQHGHRRAVIRTTGGVLSSVPSCS